MRPGQRGFEFVAAKAGRPKQIGRRGWGGRGARKAGLQIRPRLGHRLCPVARLLAERVAGEVGADHTFFIPRVKPSKNRSWSLRVTRLSRSLISISVGVVMAWASATRRCKASWVSRAGIPANPPRFVASAGVAITEARTGGA